MSDQDLENDLYQVVDQDGVVIDPEDVVFSYTREGRRVIGREYPNPIPMEPPLGFIPQVPLYEQMRDMIRRELSQAAQDQGLETAEEADDFDVDDDYDPQSPFEHDFEPTAPWPAPAAVEAAEAAAAKAVRGEGGAPPPPVEPAQPSPAAPPAKPSTS